MAVGLTNLASYLQIIQKVNTPFIKCPALHPPLKPSHSAHFHTSSTPQPPTLFPPATLSIFSHI